MWTSTLTKRKLSRRDLGSMSSSSSSLVVFLIVSCTLFASLKGQQVSPPGHETPSPVDLLMRSALAATISPAFLVARSGQTVKLNCSSFGYPITSTSWLKDGRFMVHSSNVEAEGTELTIRNFQRDDQGVYQCIVRNAFESARATASVLHGEPPTFLEVFGERELSPGEWVSLKCTATGHPLPQITWSLDGWALESSMDNVRSGDYVTSENYVISFVNISAIKPSHGGTYSCRASSEVAEAENSALIKVLGDPFVRAMANTTTVVGRDVAIKCPVGGWPVEQIFWDKNGARLPDNHRQIVYSNGTLIIREAIRETDEGYYTCTASNKEGVTSKAGLYITVQVQPVIEPFFLPNTVQMGQRLSITCTVIKGDPPIAIKWTKDGHEIMDKDSVQLGLRVHHLADYSSTLLFQSIRPNQRGNYTCKANNTVGEDSHTAAMVIHVPPNWIQEPADVGPTKGDRVWVDCQASGFPQPKIAWKRAENTSASSYKHIGSSFRVQVLENGTLFMDDVHKSDSGRYLCRASNGVGTDLSKVIRISVHEPAHFKSKFRAETYRRGESGRVTCEAFGEHPMKIDWMKDNLAYVGDPGRTFFKDTVLGDGTVSELHIKTIQRKDSALYSCRASNAYGRDETTVQLIVQEPPDTPGDLRLEQITSKSVRLLWSPPFSGNSRLTKYLLFLEEYPASSSMSSSPLDFSTSSAMSTGPNFLPSAALMSSSSQSTSLSSRKNLTIPPTETSWLISDLYPLTNYSLKVASVNGLGTSETSSPLAFATEEEVPNEPPKHVKAHPLSSKTIKVTWKAPEDRYSFGRIRGYYVGYKLFNSNQPFVYKTLQVEERSSMSSSGSGGGGGAGGGNGAFKGETVVKGLARSTKYEIVVQAYNSKGTGPSSEPIYVETYHEDAPMAITVKAVTLDHHSLKLFWKDNLENPITGYVIKFKSQLEHWDEQKVLGKASNYVLENLRCGTKYQLTIAPYNRVGRAEPSPTVTVSTAGNVPSAPSRDLLVRTNSTSATVNLKSWADNGCPIMYFVIQYKEHLLPDWLLLSNNVIPEQNQVIISDLASATYYDLSMTGHSEAGSSEAQYLFSTLTRSGAPIAPVSVTADGSVWEAILYDTAVVAPIFCICLVLLLIVVAIGYFKLDSRHKEQRHQHSNRAEPAPMAPEQHAHQANCYQSGDSTDDCQLRKCETMTKSSYSEKKREPVIVCNPVHYATCRRVPKIIGTTQFGGNTQSANIAHMTLEGSPKFRPSSSDHGYDVPHQPANQVPYMLQMHTHAVCIGQEPKFQDMD